jgi:hypothetical protein
MRPERILLSAAPPQASGDTATIAGTVSSAVYVGSRTELRIAAPGDQIIVAEASDAPGQFVATPGAAVFMTIRADDCRVLPAP